MTRLFAGQKSSASISERSRAKRLWIYSLRILAILVLAGGMIWGYQLKMRRDAIQTLESLGYNCFSASNNPAFLERGVTIGWKVRLEWKLESLLKACFTECWWKFLFPVRCAHLSHYDPGDPSATHPTVRDEHLSLLIKFPELEELTIDMSLCENRPGEGISDEGVAVLSRLPKLRRLVIVGSAPHGYRRSRAEDKAARKQGDEKFCGRVFADRKWACALTLEELTLECINLSVEHEKGLRQFKNLRKLEINEFEYIQPGLPGRPPELIEYAGPDKRPY